MSKDQEATVTVLEALRDRRTKKVNFSIACYRIGTHHYRALADAIRSGRVRVQHDETLSDTAEYSTATNTIYLGFTAATHLEHKAAIIHEATHAVCDMLRLTLMGRLASEAAAYIAQYMFIGAEMHPVNRSQVRSRRSNEPTNIGGIGSAAWRIAHANLVNVETGKKARGWGVDKDYQDLELALRQSSLYSRRIDQVVGYDGV